MKLSVKGKNLLLFFLCLVFWNEAPTGQRDIKNKHWVVPTRFCGSRWRLARFWDDF